MHRSKASATEVLNDLKQPLIDAWVKSGNDNEYHGSRYLIGGRLYPLRLEFSKSTQGVDDTDKLKDRPWTTGKAKPLNGQRLRHILRPYDIPRTSSQRIGDETRKGFTIRHFVDAWQRYTPELWQEPAPPQGAKGAKDHQVSAPDHHVGTNEPQGDTNGPQVGTKAHQVVTNPEIGTNNPNVFSVCAGVPT